MPVELNSFVWASAGIEPVNEEDAIYAAGDQPIAGYDNYFNWSISEDVHAIRDHTVAHGHEHEFGGSQQIDLDGLSVGDAVTLNHANGEYQWVHDSTQALRYDTDDGRFREFPDFGEETVHRDGVATGNDISRRDGDVIYNHSTDWFHRAEYAQDAGWADDAGDAETLDGHTPADFIRPGDATVNPTGEWNFTQRVDADIDGHAMAASYATNAGHADDSDLLDGEPRETFAENAGDESITGNWDFDQRVDIHNDEFHEFYNDTVGSTLTHHTADERYQWTPEGALGDYFGYDFASNRWNFGENVYIAGDEVATEEWVIDIAEDAFDPSEDQTITGNWEFTQTVTTDITGSASFADEAAHADDANTADFASHATTADHADQADEAEEAEYAFDSNRLDGYHASDLIDMMGGGDGRWSFIDTWEIDPGTSSSWSWDVDLESRGELWDRYRLIVVTENLSGRTSASSHYALQLNDDTRRRYKEINLRPSYNDPVDEHEYPYWRVCWSQKGTRSVHEYEIHCPQPMSTDAEHWPTISEVVGGQSTRVSHPLQYGHLETDYDRIEEMSMFHNSDQANHVFIKLLGNDIFR